MTRYLTALFFLCLSYSMEGWAQEVHCDTILANRIYEYIGLFKDYLHFISQKQKPLKAKCYYEKKAKSLFTPDAQVIIYKNGIEFQKEPIDSFLFHIRNSELSLSNISIDSIQVPNWNSNRLESQQDALWVDCQIISIAKTITYSHQDSIMLTKEMTEMRDEWRPLLSNLYITYKLNSIEKDEIKQDNIHPPIVVDCTNGDQSTISQRVKQKHVQCKSKTRGRVLQPVQRSRSEKRHSKQKQRRKEEESSHAIEPSQLQICN